MQLETRVSSKFQFCTDTKRYSFTATELLFQSYKSGVISN